LGLDQGFLSAGGAPARQGEWHLWVAAAGWAPRLGLVLNSSAADYGWMPEIGFGLHFSFVAFRVLLVKTGQSRHEILLF